MLDIMPLIMALPWVPTMLHVWRQKLWYVLKVTYLGTTLMPTPMATH